MNNCKTISISNQKGGVAKTSTAFNLGYALTLQNKKVLLVDLDPQSSLTICFGAEQKAAKKSISDIFAKVINEDEYDVSDYIQKYERGELLHILPCNIGFIATEDKLRNEIGSERTLATILEPLREVYDFIIIDTAPSLGLLSVNALSSADEVIVTASPQFLSAVGIRDLLKTINKVRKHINPNIKIGGILLTMCDERTNLFNQIQSLVYTQYGGEVYIFESSIPTSTKVGEANLNQTTVIEFAPKSRPALAYLDIAKDIISKESEGQSR